MPGGTTAYDAPGCGFDSRRLRLTNARGRSSRVEQVKTSHHTLLSRIDGHGHVATGLLRSFFLGRMRTGLHRSQGCGFESRRTAPSKGSVRGAKGAFAKCLVGSCRREEGSDGPTGRLVLWRDPPRKGMMHEGRGWPKEDPVAQLDQSAALRTRRAQVRVLPGLFDD